MLADSGVLTNSPWHSDSLLKEAGQYFRHAPADLPLQGMDLDLAVLECEIERVRQNQQNTSDLSQFSLNLDSCGTSVASSECSDEPYLDTEGSLEELLFSSNTADQTYLSTSLQNLLELGDVSGTLEWTDSSSCLTGEVNTEELLDIQGLVSPSSNPESTSTTSCQVSQQQQPSHRKRWSEMSSDEQIEVVEDLSRVISNELGLREQLEVIRLINPAAAVSPTDKEFVIDLESITEEKLKQIQEFIRKHTDHMNCVDVSPEGFQSPQKKHTKKLTKDRKNQHKAVRQRQRKEYRQMMKEKRSGLFVKEEVLALSICEPIEEADVDILA